MNTATLFRAVTDRGEFTRRSKSHNAEKPFRFAVIVTQNVTRLHGFYGKLETAQAEVRKYNGMAYGLPATWEIVPAEIVQ